MNERNFDVSAFLTGLVFAVLGTLFLVDALDVAQFRFEIVLPAILIALGVAVIAGAALRSRGGSPS
jgi:uncharacterized integral membrane protein